MSWTNCLTVLMAAGLLGGISSRVAVAAEQRVLLRPEMMISESGIGDAEHLVDEQQAVGDPASGKGTRPATAFFPGWKADDYPVSVVVDLGAVRRLTRVFLYNESGENPVTLSTGGPTTWKTQEIVVGGYRQWDAFPVSAPTRYLRLTLTHPASLSELVVYAEGEAIPAASPIAPQKTPRVRPTMDQFIGANAFIDDPIEKLSIAVGFVREYHNWSWDTEGPDHRLRFQPSGAAGGKAWFFDDFYARLSAKGVMVCPAIQQTNIVSFPGAQSDAKPVSPGQDAENPAAYAVHAAHLFQFAARYGRTAVAENRLQLAADQPRRSGLGSLRYLENWNEPDKTWRGREGRFTPFELAAMCSADYDGDQKRMGRDVGIRNADPSLRLVMGGLAGLNLPYLKAMKFWADIHRSGDFPADVLNLHHYSSDGTEQGFKTAGISPEADHLREKMAAIVRWRDQNAPHCEVWLTEFGYDTNPHSPLHAPTLGSFSAEQVQAMWLVRSFLALAAAGIDRAALFMFRDVKSDDGGVFATCGLVTEKGKWTPKPSYFCVAALKKHLAGMRFAEEIVLPGKELRVYRFVGNGGKSAYAVWSPTSEDRHVSAVSLPLSPRFSGKTVTQIQFSFTDAAGKVSSLPVRNHAVMLSDVGELPTLILVSEPKP